MPLTKEELEEIQAEHMADDLEIDLEKMSLWTKEQANDYFESGGEVVPGAGPVGPEPVASVPWAPLKDEALKKWFPKLKQQEQKPKFRLICFHNAGSSESVYSGKGMRQKEDNPFVVHCAQNGGELWACELPGREQRRSEKRRTELQPYCKEDLLPVLEPVIKQDVPYVIIGHSMGTWMSYEFIKLLAEKGLPLPKMLFVGGFPGPNIPVGDRPWNKNRSMNDDAFKEECKGWNVNEIVFQEPNWKTFGGMMRDDFTLFDEYAYTDPPAHVVKGEFPIPIRSFYFQKDLRIKKNHVEMWKNFTTDKQSFTCEEMEGNHLFFYDVPARKAWMDKVISKLPF